MPFTQNILQGRVLLYQFNIDEFTVSNIVILVCGSYVVFIAINGYMLFLRKTKAVTSFNFTMIIGIIASALVLISIIVNLRNEPVLFFPLMYMISLLSSFILWGFFSKETTPEGQTPK